MKIVIIVDKINHIIIALRKEEVSDADEKRDTFLEVCAFQILLYHPEPSFCCWWCCCVFFLSNRLIIPACSQPSELVKSQCCHCWTYRDGPHVWRKLQMPDVSVGVAELLPPSGSSSSAAGRETSLLCPPVAVAVKHFLSSSSICSQLESLWILLPIMSLAVSS